jgi:SPP1 family predicted phage head-tail adaptor
MPESTVIAAGDLIYSCQIEQPSDIVDEGGGKERIWGLWRDVRVSLEPFFGGEQWASAQVQMTVTHKVRMRYFPGLKANMRLRIDSRILAIRLIKDVMGKQRKYLLLCEEQQGQS